MTVRAVAVLVGISLLAVGCRIDVGTELTVDARGRGDLGISIRIDGATLRELDRVGVDPALDVELVLGQDSGWRTSRSVDEDGGLVLTYRHAFTDGDGATALLRELSEGVAPQDPAIDLDVVVSTTPRGAVRIDGTGGIVPPATIGVRIDDEVVGPAGDELAALVAGAVRAELVVRVAGAIVADDADVRDGRTARWVLEVGEQRPITLVADAPGWWARWPLALWLGLLTAIAVGAAAVRRRRGVSRAA